MKVRDMMTCDIETIARDTTLLRADELMETRAVRHLPVVDGDVLVGVVSHRDVLAASVPSVSRVDEADALAFMRQTRVETIMRSAVETTTPDGDAGAAAQRLLDLKIGCLPVVDERRHVVGIVTETDFVRIAAAVLRRSRAA